MALTIEQRFPLGRFHATRWKQGAFGDPFGEWPPSPYRLLRALAMRWFQYAREMGWSNDKEKEERKNKLWPLLQALAASLPSFYLPPWTWRGLAIKQYHPTAIEWTDKSKKAGGYKKPSRTLVEDHYRAVYPEDAVLWHWENLNLEDEQLELLDRLLERVIYFGRAESFCLMRRRDALPEGKEVNCRLSEKGDGVPVLAQIPGDPLDFEALLCRTGDKKIREKPIPPGTRWFYAKLPALPKVALPRPVRRKRPQEIRCIQFAVGGRVFPPLRLWVKLAERFRGRAVKNLALALKPDSEGKYERLDREARHRLALLCGKDEEGKPLVGHRHAYFLLWPDEQGNPTRLIVWRDEPFEQEEIEALLKASERPISWEPAAPRWKVRLVPLPFEMSPPSGFLESARVWRSITPFVPPAERHRFRRNGRERRGETLERIVGKLVEGRSSVTRVEKISETIWVNLHETRERRRARKETGTPWMRPGYLLRIEFDKPLKGPLIIGDSCHFGLGIFVPEPG